MPNARTANFLSGLLGGLVAIIAGAILIATDVIDTGDDTQQVVQQSPITQPAASGGGGGGDKDKGAPTVGQIYDRTGPGVVYVEATGGERDSPFGLPDEGGAATGSGFVLDRDGYILTNAHVVEDAEEVKVRFGEGDPVDAELVGTDPSTDIAVIKVEPGEAELKPIELGDSSAVKVGDPTIAIGNPFGFDRTVTTGIVSALQREIEAPNGFSISDVIQTDASINPGNSGGPLLDGAGRVIGINSQIATGGSQGSVGIGFAVPINTAKDVIPQLKDEGEVKRAFLGITTAPVTQDLAEEHDLPADRGALVQEVVRDGPSDDAGIRAGDDEVEPNLVIGGDLITKVDGVDIQEPQDVADAIADNKPGDKVTIEFYRGDERKSVEVELGERPDEVPGSGGGGGGGGDEDQPRPFPFP